MKLIKEMEEKFYHEKEGLDWIKRMYDLADLFRDCHHHEKALRTYEKILGKKKKANGKKSLHRKSD